MGQASGPYTETLDVKSPENISPSFDLHLQRVLDEVRDLVNARHGDGSLLVNAPGGAANALRVRLYDRAQALTKHKPDTWAYQAALLSLAGLAVAAVLVEEGRWSE